MCSKEFLLLACLNLFGGLRLTSTTTTTTFVAAMSIVNQDLDRYFRLANASQTLTAMNEDRIAMDSFTYAYITYAYTDIDGKVIVVPHPQDKGRYGEGRVFDVKGKLVHISDADNVKDDNACTANIMGTQGEPTPAEDVPWIALVRRGRCTFEEKVKNVYSKGAHGVLIYNDKPVMNLEKMQIKGKSRNITAVITYAEIGIEMARLLDQGFEMNAEIRKGQSGTRPINSLNRTSVLFVSISFIVLMVISLVWLIFYYVQRFRYLQTKDQQSRHLCSVTKKAIMKIPTKTGKSTDEKDADSDCCAICIETYKASDCIRVLPCKHEFHKSCIDPWLIEHRTCPMCKLDVLKFYGFVVGDQINATPSPQHMPPNVAPVDDNDVPVIVVAVAAAAAATQPHATQLLEPLNSVAASMDNNSSSSSSSDNSSSQLAPYAAAESSHHTISTVDNSLSNNSRHDFSSHNSRSTQTRATVTDGVRRNSAPLVLQVSTASRQVTDV